MIRVFAISKKYVFGNKKKVIANVIAVLIASLIITSPNRSFLKTSSQVQMADILGIYPGYPEYMPSIVGITVPADGDIFIAPANILIFAGAVNLSTRVAQVDFYQNYTLIATNHFQPFSYMWKDVPAGIYTLIVTATDDAGITTASFPVTIAVIDATASGCTCLEGCPERVEIAPPFSIDGAGKFCFETDSLGSFVLSWNLDRLEINGVSLRNAWANKFPPKRGGKYFIYYETHQESGHFEMR